MAHMGAGQKAKDGRKKIAKSTKEKLEEAVVCYYLENDEELICKRMTLRDLYPDWLEYKKLHSSETTIPRIESDWKKYYENDPDSVPVISKRIRELNPDNPDEPGTLEPKGDVAQTPVQKPEIGTTLTGNKKAKEVKHGTVYTDMDDR